MSSPPNARRVGYRAVGLFGNEGLVPLPDVLAANDGLIEHERVSLGEFVGRFGAGEDCH